MSFFTNQGNLCTSSDIKDSHLFYGLKIHLNTQDYVSALQLRHDVAQLDYLIEQGRISEEASEIVDHFSNLLQHASHVALDQEDKKKIIELYSNLNSNPLDLVTVNLSSQSVWSQLSDKIYSAISFLPETVANNIHKLCLNSPFWFDEGFNQKTLVLSQNYGFEHPALIELGEKIQTQFPEHFESLKLKSICAKKNLDEDQQAKLTAEQSKKILTVFLTPANAMHHTFKIWHHAYPNHWGIEDLCDNESGLREYLRTNQSKATSIPVEHNHAVIHEGNLLMEWKNHQKNISFDAQPIALQFCFD